MVVGVPILFTDKTFVLDFTSIATLFAFVLVCGGVLLIPRKGKSSRSFSYSLYQWQFLYPLIIVLSLTLFVMLSKIISAIFLILIFQQMQDYNEGKVSFMDLATPNISVIIFWIICFILAIATAIKKYSLIPLMGVTTCLYLLTE
jgi:hypothetical protein